MHWQVPLSVTVHFLQAAAVGPLYVLIPIFPISHNGAVDISVEKTASEIYVTDSGLMTNKYWPTPRFKLSLATIKAGSSPPSQAFSFPPSFLPSSTACSQNQSLPILCLEACLPQPSQFPFFPSIIRCSSTSSWETFNNLHHLLKTSGV